MTDISHEEAQAIKIANLEEKLVYKRKRFWINTIELLFGIVFLVISFNYLKTHPAERMSVFSSIDSMVTRVEKFTGNLFGSTSEIESQKNELIASYTDLLGYASRETCDASDLSKQITVRLNQLTNLDDEEYSKQQAGFRNYLSIYANQLAQICPE